MRRAEIALVNILESSRLFVPNHNTCTWAKLVVKPGR